MCELTTFSELLEGSCTLCGMLETYQYNTMLFVMLQTAWCPQQTDLPLLSFNFETY